MNITTTNSSASVVSNDTVLNKMKSESEKKEAKINELFETIINGTQEFEDLDMSPTEKYDVLIAHEYLLTRLRLLIADELRRLDFALSNEAVLSTAEKVFVTKRKNYLLTVNTRLNEIREDLNTLQKTTYFLKSRF